MQGNFDWTREVEFYLIDILTQGSRQGILGQFEVCIGIAVGMASSLMHGYT